MSVFFAASAFSRRKAKTQPLVDVPQNVGEALNIDAYHEKGDFKIEPGEGVTLYDRCYVFEEINYKNKNDEEKDRVLRMLASWLNTMNVDFKICHANEFREVDNFLRNIISNKNGEKFPFVSKGLMEFVEDKVDTSEANTSKKKYLVITCRAVNFKEAKSYHDSLEVVLFSSFKIWRSGIRRLSAMERFSAIRAFFLDIENNVEETKNYMSNGFWKNGITPTAIESHSEYMIINNTYVSVLYARDYGRSVDEGKVVYDFTNVAFPSYVTLDVAPVDRKTLKEKLTNAHVGNEAAIEKELDGKAKRGARFLRPSYHKTKRDEELEGYRAQVDDNNEKAFFIGILIVVTANSLEELDGRIRIMKEVGKGNDVYVDIYVHQQLKALNTALPLGGRQVNHMRSFLTSSAVAFQSYHAQDIQHLNGVFHGMNRTTKRMIMIDRKKLSSPHGMIIGKTGGGKSVLIKLLEIVQTLLMTDDDVIIIDPQNETEILCENIGGQFLDFTPGGDLKINGFEVPPEVYSDDKKIQGIFIGKQLEYAKSLCEAIMHNIDVTSEHVTIIGEAVRAMYDKVFTSKKIKVPTLKHFRDEIKLYKEGALEAADQENARIIYNSLAEYCDGIYDMFAHPTNVDINNRFVSFGLKNLSKGLWEVSMVTIMHFLRNRMDYNVSMQRATRFIIDEGQVVTRKETSGNILLETYETYRKFGGICTIAIQNFTRSIESPVLRDMFSNCSYKVFLEQKSTDALAVSQIQELSAAEFEALQEASVGHGLVVVEDKVMMFDMFLDSENPLYNLFNTNFHEKAEQSKKVFRLGAKKTETPEMVGA